MKDIELPPLPDSGQNGNQTTDYFGKLFEYTRQDMRSYARAAVEADRAQRVTDGYDQGSAECMAAVQQILDGKDRGDGVAREPWESIRRRLIALVAPAPAQQEPSEAEMVCAEAYQVVGCLLSDLGLFETEAARKILDNLSEARMVHQDVLPWESAVAHQEPPQPVERKPMTRAQVEEMSAQEELLLICDDIESLGQIVEAVERHHGIKERAMLTKERIDKHALQAVDCPPATWVVLRSAMHRLVDKESAATAPLLARIAELERQLEEARKNAERYQAIRSGLDMDAIVRVTKDPGMWETPYPVLLRGEELDAAIDAAIKEQT